MWIRPLRWRTIIVAWRGGRWERVREGEGGREGGREGKRSWVKSLCLKMEGYYCDEVLRRTLGGGKVKKDE